MVPHVVPDLVVRPVSLFVLEEIGVSGRVEPVGARAEGELDFVHGPDGNTNKRNKETSPPALLPFLNRNLKEKNRTSVPANEKPAGRAVSPMGIGIVLAL